MTRKYVPPRVVLAANLKALMASKGLNGPAVAKAAGIGRKSVNNMLNARHSPDLDNVEAVARVFGLTAWQLIRESHGADIPASAQVDALIGRFYDAGPEQRKTILGVAEMTGPYKAK
jgi:transcriptional regulator with XRE-family HTH domain